MYNICVLKYYTHMNIDRYEFYDIKTDEDFQMTSDFLDKYYFQGSVEDAAFKLHYSADHIKWLVSVSEEKHDHLCYALVFKGTKILAGFIMGTVVEYVHNDENIRMTEVNLLCVHPKLRRQNYGLYLINEFVRRVGLINHTEAIYTGVNKLGPPSVYMGTATYYHRPLNLDYLIELGFTDYGPYKSIKEKKSMLRLPQSSKYLKELTIDNLETAHKMFSGFISKYKLYPIMSQEMFIKTFYNNNYVKCYLCYNEDKIVDMISYYIIPYKHIESGKIVKAVLLYYYTNYSNNLQIWIKNLMIIARNNGFHLFNALNIMDNQEILNDLHFEEGTGILHYLVYKHKVTSIEANEIGKILF